MPILREPFIHSSQSAHVTIILIDNFDSFTYNLVHQLRNHVHRVFVYRNDISVSWLRERCLMIKERVILAISPGYGSPKTAGNLLSILNVFKNKYPILGICLGHQAIIEICGGRLRHAKSVVHGESHVLNILEKGDSFFKGLTPFFAARYHSLSGCAIPEALDILADCDGEVMMVKHKTQKMIGLQFHPESILTPNGSELIRRILNDFMS
jgi:anthranilate synthase/aminodeoxychorismate synthase-like glutamine amidotransferase